MSIKTYAQALAYWYGRINYEQTQMPVDRQALKLDRMRALLDELDRPHEKLKCIHIAGTKGKGSTAAFLASILSAAGYRTGLFTSPHLERVEERIRVQGKNMTPEELTLLMARVEQAAERIEKLGHGSPTFFEILTAIGFMHFDEQRVDIVVLEVGLGGRFDATNVIDPLLTVITSISFDHMAQLGNTLSAIAFEKAGIIKPHTSVILAHQHEEVDRVIQNEAKEKDAPIWDLRSTVSIEYEPGQIEIDQKPRLRIVSGRDETAWMELGLHGRHQAENAALAWLAISRLPVPWKVSAEAVRQGLREVKWPARMEIVHRHPWVVLDCAHNGASMECLVNSLSEMLPCVPGQRRHLILAISKDKDLERMLPVLTKSFNHAMMTRYSSSSRGADPHEMAVLWQCYGGKEVTIEANPASAWEKVKQSARPEDVVVITGSVFLAGEMRSLFCPTDSI